MLGHGCNTGSDAARRRLELLAGVKSQKHRNEGINEFPGGNALMQGLCELVGASRIGNRRAIEREHGERARMIQGPSLLEAVERLLEPPEGPEGGPANVERLGVARIDGQSPIAGLEH